MPDIELWLKRLGLEKYAEVLARHDVDLDVAPSLTEQDLEKLGLSLGHRRKFIAAAAEPESKSVSASKKEKDAAKRQRAIEAHKPPGPPSSFKPEFTEEVERLCKLGVRDVDLCLFFNVSMQTIKNWQKKYPEFFMAMLRGKQRADTNVAAALYKKAIDGDTTAQIFYLKNRRPDLWRDVSSAPEEELAKNAKVYVGAAVLEALKAKGHVMLEGEYEVIEGEVKP
jgi:hypothetical protein